MQTTRQSALLGFLGLLALLVGSTVSCSDPTPAAGNAPPSPTPTVASDSAVVTDPDDQTIVFQRSGSLRTHLAWVAPDGSGAAAVLPDYGDGNQVNPDWSPDGTQLVFAMTDGTTDDLFLARAGQPEGRKLLDCVAPCLALDDPSWSPDGEFVVYSRTVASDGVGVGTLEVVEVATGEVRVLLGPWTEQFTAGARWSPDGHKIVFEMVSKTGPGLDADVSGVTLSVVRLDPPNSTAYTLTDPELLAARGLTDPALFAATPDWSPDGRWVVYSALVNAGDAATELFLVPRRGGAPQRLTELTGSGGYAADPTFAPDGGVVVFSGTRSSADADGVLLQVRADGSGLSLATGDVEVPGDHPRVR